MWRQILRVLVLVSLLVTTQIYAMLLPICHSPEENEIEKIRSILFRINQNGRDSNISSIAFIIAAAITAKHNVQLDIGEISEILDRETKGNRLVSLLDIKEAISQLGYSVEGKLAENPEEVLMLSNQILIAQDQHKNFIAVIASHNDAVYLIYGILHQKALICSIHKSVFLESYTTQKFLILN